MLPPSDPTQGEDSPHVSGRHRHVFSTSLDRLLERIHIPDRGKDRVEEVVEIIEIAVQSAGYQDGFGTGRLRLGGEHRAQFAAGRLLVCPPLAGDEYVRVEYFLVETSNVGDEVSARRHLGSAEGSETGAEATGGPNHRPDNRKVIILLTDGLPNQVPYAEDGTMATTVLNEAIVAKADGNKIYTIAIGQPADTNPDLLMGMATDPTMYYYMPDADDLERVYSEIYGSLGCPTIRYAGP